MFVSVNGHDLKGAEYGKYTGIILIDFQKAFDTFDYKVLSEKNAVHMFFRKKKTIKWFHSYLTSRGFFISVNNLFWK